MDLPIVDPMSLKIRKGKIEMLRKIKISIVDNGKITNKLFIFFISFFSPKNHFYAEANESKDEATKEDFNQKLRPPLDRQSLRMICHKSWNEAKLLTYGLSSNLVLSLLRLDFTLEAFEIEN